MEDEKEEAHSPMPKRPSDTISYQESEMDQIRRRLHHAENAAAAAQVQLHHYIQEADMLREENDLLSMDNTQLDRSITDAFEAYHELDAQLDEAKDAARDAESYAEYEMGERQRYTALYGIAKYYRKLPFDLHEIIKPYL
ncbi:hypothetical protein [Crucivirus-407]|nr:hypothetical protein [Crucivirus-406]QMW68870.1 hypothetical protein [Crucivirus-407]